MTEALNRGGIADITTIGRKSGLPRRIEIYFHQFDGEYYLTGRPGFKRDWVANIGANPEFTLHLKRGVRVDVPVRGVPEPDREERARILLRALVESWGSDPERSKAALDRWVDTAPFIRFEPVGEWGPGSGGHGGPLPDVPYPEADQNEDHPHTDRHRGHSEGDD